MPKIDKAGLLVCRHIGIFSCHREGIVDHTTVRRLIKHGVIRYDEMCQSYLSLVREDRPVSIQAAGDVDCGVRSCGVYWEVEVDMDLTSPGCVCYVIRANKFYHRAETKIFLNDATFADATVQANLTRAVSALIDAINVIDTNC